jgi:hypothetical protein
MTKRSTEQRREPSRTSPHAKIIGEWEASGLDASVAKALRYLDLAHKLDRRHLERMQALFLRATRDDRWEALGENRPSPGERLSLDEAFRSLSVDEALTLFEQSDLFDLDQRQAVMFHLTNCDTPFYTLSELATTIQHALKCHERNRKYLLKYGHALTDFQRCFFLSHLVSRLYYVRLPHSGFNTRAALVPRGLLRKLFPPDNPPEPQDYVYFADEANRPVVSAFRSWGTIDDIAKADRERLTQMRASLYVLKARILDLLERAVRTCSTEGLWEKCFGLIADSITTEEAEFCLRVDRVYEGYDIRTGKMVDEDPGLIAGGLTTLLETIGHCEKEIAIGPLCHCKEALEAKGMAGLDKLGRGEVRTSYGKKVRSYFDLTSDPKRDIFDAAIDDFLGLSGQEGVFWHEYMARVARDFENELYEEVGIRKKVKRRFVHRFKPHLAQVVDLIAGHLEVTDELPDWSLRADKRTDSAQQSGRCGLQESDRGRLLGKDVTASAAQRWLAWIDRTLMLSERVRWLHGRSKRWRIIEGKECPGEVVGVDCEGLDLRKSRPIPARFLTPDVLEKAPWMETARAKFFSGEQTHYIYTEDTDYWPTIEGFQAHLLGFDQIAAEMSSFCPPLFEQSEKTIDRLGRLLYAASQTRRNQDLPYRHHFVLCLKKLGDSVREIVSVATPQAEVVPYCASADRVIPGEPATDDKTVPNATGGRANARSESGMSEQAALPAVVCFNVRLTKALRKIGLGVVSQHDVSLREMAPFIYVHAPEIAYVWPSTFLSREAEEAANDLVRAHPPTVVPPDLRACVVETGSLAVAFAEEILVDGRPAAFEAVVKTAEFLGAKPVFHPERNPPTRRYDEAILDGLMPVREGVILFETQEDPINVWGPSASAPAWTRRLLPLLKSGLHVVLTPGENESAADSEQKDSSNAVRLEDTAVRIVPLYETSARDTLGLAVRVGQGAILVLPECRDEAAKAALVRLLATNLWEELQEWPGVRKRGHVSGRGRGRASNGRSDHEHDQRYDWNYLKEWAEEERRHDGGIPFRVLRESDGREAASVLDALILQARETWSAHAPLCEVTPNEVFSDEVRQTFQQCRSSTETFFATWWRTYQCLLEAERWLYRQYGPGEDVKILDQVAGAMMDLIDIFRKACANSSAPATGEPIGQALTTQLSAARKQHYPTFQKCLVDLFRAAAAFGGPRGSGVSGHLVGAEGEGKEVKTLVNLVQESDGYHWVVDTRDSGRLPKGALTHWSRILFQHAGHDTWVSHAVFQAEMGAESEEEYWRSHKENRRKLRKFIQFEYHRNDGMRLPKGYVKSK